LTTQYLIIAHDFDKRMLAVAARRGGSKAWMAGTTPGHDAFVASTPARDKVRRTSPLAKAGLAGQSQLSSGCHLGNASS